ncbi:ArsR/SmtB family transcription factor (plasmid) [Coraliomargarita sp. W4R53]
MSDDSQSMKDEIDALAARVATLESQSVVHKPQLRSSQPHDEPLWALAGLQSRLNDHPSTRDGAVMLVGSVTLPEGTPVVWQQSAGTSAILEGDWSERSDVFSALAHPVRLELLRHILSGIHSTADLAALDLLGTTGQLHHHLRPLVSAGWVQQSGRGSYEIPAARIVPLLACLAGAQR